MADLDLFVSIEATAKQLLLEVSRARSALDPGLTGAAGDAENAVGKIGDSAKDTVGAAFKELGIKSQAQLNQIAEKARVAFDKIKSDGTAAPQDIERAFNAYQRAAAAAADTSVRGFKKVEDSAAQAGAGVDKATGKVAELKTELGRLLTLEALRRATGGSLEAARALEASYRGLESVAEFTGVGIGAAFEQAAKLSDDGLMTVGEGAQALQNLLLRGFTLDKAVESITRLKDAAAFGRQAALGLGEAVVSATEGLKNENSVLVDNAGVTKNVAVMWKEYAERIGVAVTELTQAQKVEAEYQGILRETAPQLGNAAKAAAGLEGDMAALNKAVNEVQVAFGAALFPAVEKLARGGKFLADNFLKPVLMSLEIIPAALAAVEMGRGQIMDAIFSGDFSRVDDIVRLHMTTLAGYAKDVADRYTKGVTPAMLEGAAATRDAGKAAGEAADATAGLTKEAATLGKTAPAAHEAAASGARSHLAALRQLQANMDRINAEFDRFGTIPAPERMDVSYLDVAMKQAEANRALVEGDLQAAMRLAREAGGLLDLFAEGVDPKSELAKREIEGLRDLIKAVALEAQSLADAELFKAAGLPPIGIKPDTGAFVAEIRAAVETMGVIEIPARIRLETADGGVAEIVREAADSAGARPR